MIHFAGAGDYWQHKWGVSSPTLRFISPRVAWVYSLQAASARTAGLTGQRLGGIGFYRTETDQPRFNEVDGAYSFDTYLTTYSFVNGQYSFALIVAISLAETFNTADAVTPSVAYAVALAETLNTIETLAVTRSIPVDLLDSVSMADTYVFNGVYGVILPESLVVDGVVGVNDSLVAYAVNTSNGAVTTYDNYNFNSFATMNGKFYGATSDGIFELAGNTDNGTAIPASIKFGTTELSTDTIPAENMKRLPAVYLGVSTTGDMVLKVTANGLTNNYTLTPATASSLHTGRLLLGKGVESRYWDFEMTNVAGADFTLESILLRPEVLVRRATEGG